MMFTIQLKNQSTMLQNQFTMFQNQSTSFPTILVIPTAPEKPQKNK